MYRYQKVNKARIAVHSEMLDAGEILPFTECIEAIIDVETDTVKPTCFAFTDQELAVIWSQAADDCVSSHIRNLYETPDSDFECLKDCPEYSDMTAGEIRTAKVAEWENSRPRNRRRQYLRSLSI